MEKEEIDMIELIWHDYKEREHRPRTVLNQLYNYRGGIVPNAAEANQQVISRKWKISLME